MHGTVRIKLGSAGPSLSHSANVMGTVRLHRNNVVQYSYCLLQLYLTGAELSFECLAVVHHLWYSTFASDVWVTDPSFVDGAELIFHRL